MAKYTYTAGDTYTVGKVSAEKIGLKGGQVTLTSVSKEGMKGTDAEGNEHTVTGQMLGKVVSSTSRDITSDPNRFVPKAKKAKKGALVIPEGVATAAAAAISAGRRSRKRLMEAFEAAATEAKLDPQAVLAQLQPAS